jgi:hypothetical protein
LRRIALAAVIATSSFAALAGSAGAAPLASLCGSVNVTVNGQALIDESQCQVLPPEQR